MSVLDIGRAFVENKVLVGAFKECCLCLGDVDRVGREIMVSPRGTPGDFVISAGALPAAMYMPHRNFFSTFFQAVYALLDIAPERRLFYGRINYLFRIWVTSADNLLDDEDKVFFPIKMPADSRVMRQVVAVMAADRIMGRFIAEAVSGGVITPEQARIVADGTLQVLLPSAAEEASEEAGIVKRPRPEYVLNTIHQLKTGLLFHLPLFGPERIEKEVDLRVMALARQGLGKFGLGCQLADDMRDLARDHIERRHNYALSLMTYQHRAAGKRLKEMEGDLPVDKAVFHQFQEELTPVARDAYGFMVEGLSLLDACGLGLGEAARRAVALGMFKALDIEKAVGWIR